MNVILIEDHADLSGLIADQLKANGMNCDTAFSGEQALETINPDLHDLIILDRGLPDMEGLELLKILREEGIKMPVLVLTAKDGLGDKVEGLNSGADDYLVKPFEMPELMARIHALYRRPMDTTAVIWQCGNIQFNPAESTITVNGQPTEFSVKEKRALERIMRLPGKVVSKDNLHAAMYGLGEEGTDNSVEVTIHRLRKKLDQAGANSEIKTLRGIGYVMKEKEA